MAADDVKIGAPPGANGADDSSTGVQTREMPLVDVVGGPIGLLFMYVVVLPFAVGMSTLLEDRSLAEILLGVLLGLAGLSLALLALVNMSDPGRLQGNPDPAIHSSPPPEPVTSINCVKKIDGVQYKWCVTCKLWKPPRTTHCNTCGFCVMRFDHHCPVVGNCIGLHNHRWFACFLLSASFALLLCALIYGYRLAEIDWPRSGAWKHWEAWVLPLSLCMCGCPSLQLCAFGCGTGLMLCCNKTTKERIKGTTAHARAYMGTLGDVCCQPVRLRPQYIDICAGEPHYIRVRPKPRYVKPDPVVAPGAEPDTQMSDVAAPAVDMESGDRSTGEGGAGALGVRESKTDVNNN